MATRTVSHSVNTTLPVKQLARIMCVANPDEEPCGACEDAAVRAWTQREAVRDYLTKAIEA